MTASIDLLTDAFDRIAQTVHRTVDGADAALLSGRVDPDANSIAWLVWHLTRIQDDHVSEVAGLPQAWHENGWEGRFALPFDSHDTGYGHSSADVAEVGKVSAQRLLGYHDDVHERTVAFLGTLADDDFARVVDENWSPPVTLGVRLVSVISDDLQHAGQAAYVRGVLERQ
ncbi:mycothiol transferase [Leifsonia poae]|uniref:mycothiol transferase n=1 Tax=Leifsonia poae TaxID=110933 RepID=UPI003D667943